MLRINIVVMLIKSGKRHDKPHAGKRSPLVDKISMGECLAGRIMDGSIMEKLGTILDLVKVHEKGQIGTREARAMLLGALADESRQVRWSAVYALGQMDDLKGLLAGLGNDCQVVRSMSAAMIYATLRKRDFTETFHPNEFMERLTRAMAEGIASDDKSVSIYCASALAEIAKRDPISVIRVIDGMRESIDDVGAMVRLRGVEIAADDALREMAARNRA